MPILLFPDVVIDRLIPITARSDWARMVDDVLDRTIRGHTVAALDWGRPSAAHGRWLRLRREQSWSGTAPGHPATGSVVALRASCSWCGILINRHDLVEVQRAHLNPLVLFNPGQPDLAAVGALCGDRLARHPRAQISGSSGSPWLPPLPASGHTPARKMGRWGNLPARVRTTCPEHHQTIGHRVVGHWRKQGLGAGWPEYTISSTAPQLAPPSSEVRP